MVVMPCHMLKLVGDNPRSNGDLLDDQPPMVMVLVINLDPMAISWRLN